MSPRRKGGRTIEALGAGQEAEESPERAPTETRPADALVLAVVVDLDDRYAAADVDEQARELGGSRVGVERERVLGWVGRRAREGVGRVRWGEDVLLVRVRDGLHELVRVPEHLVRDLHDEAQAEDEALHLLLAADLDAQLVAQALEELMCPAARGHYFYALLHDFEGDAVRGGGGGDEGGEEGDAGREVGGFKLDKVEAAAGDVGGGGAAGGVGFEGRVAARARGGRWDGRAVCGGLGAALGCEGLGAEDAVWFCGSGGRIWRGGGAPDLCWIEGWGRDAAVGRGCSSRSAGEVDDLGERSSDLKTGSAFVLR